MGIISTGNPFATYYANPLAQGLPNGNTNTRFGTPLYATLSTMFGSTATGASSRLGGGGFGSSGLGSGLNSGSIGTRGRPAAYTATLGFRPLTPLGSRMQADLQGVLARSSSLSAPRNLELGMDGGTVVLRGMVSNDAERRHAEALIRLSPGVRDVRNEIQVNGATAPPP
jgi:hypothetical protein